MKEENCRLIIASVFQTSIRVSKLQSRISPFYRLVRLWNRRCSLSAPRRQRNCNSLRQSTAPKSRDQISYRRKWGPCVFFFIKQFRQYLLDKLFTVISDHRPLQWFQDQKDVNGRLGRWAIALSAVNYKIRYRPGRIHQNADCLSRLKVASIQTVDIPRLPEIVKQQRTDETCVMIRNYLLTGQLPTDCQQNFPTWAKEIEFF